MMTFDGLLFLRVNTKLWFFVTLLKNVPINMLILLFFTYSYVQLIKYNVILLNESTPLLNPL